MNREQLERDAARRIAACRVKIFLNRGSSVFFATLAKRLIPKVSWEVNTMATDGRHMFYNPAFTMSLTMDECVGVNIHEILHPANKHHLRRQNRDRLKWNVACDLAINTLILESGFKLPAGGCFPGRPPFHDMDPGLSAEKYYALLTDEQMSQVSDQMDPGGCGEVRDFPGDSSESSESDAEWSIAVSQAAQLAQRAGKIPAGLDRFIKEILSPRVDWREQLRDFVSRVITAKDDYSWSSPNRRFISQGLYLPSLRSDALGEFVVAIDTSGSIDNELLKAFAGELNGILECRPCKVRVVYCDHKVHRVDEWEPCDGELQLNAVGGGGTSHSPVWDWLEENDASPEAVICLTDGYTYHGEAPPFPVLWVITPNGHADVPFGRAIQLQ